MRRTLPVRPEIEEALRSVGAVRLWTEISSQYDRIPFTAQKLDTDIVGYASGPDDGAAAAGVRVRRTGAVAGGGELGDCRYSAFDSTA